jgi:hypothetical protein
MGTADIMEKIGCKLPPYHGRCRTTTIASSSTVVKKSSGGVFSGNAAYDKGNSEAKKRADVVKKLSRDELLTKVDSLVKTGYWDDREREWPDGTTQDSYNYHKRKHDREFEKGFDSAFKTLLNKYDKVYTFGENGEWIYYDTGSKSFLHVSELGRILRFHKYSRFRPKKYMVEIE